MKEKHERNFPLGTKRESNPRPEVARQAKKDGKNSSLREPDTSVTCRTPNLQKQTTTENTKGKSCSWGKTSRTKKDTEQYLESEAPHLHSRQRQNSWTPSQSFVVWPEKHVTQFQRTLSKGAKVLIGGSAQGTCPPLLKDEVDGQEEGQGDKREDDGEQREGSGVVEVRTIRHNDHNAHEAWV